VPLVSIEPRERKTIRLQGYDYSKSGVYFVTVCVTDRHMLLGNVIENKVVLTEIGQIVEDAIQVIPSVYDSVSVERHVVMPNHVHMLLVLRSALDHAAPSVSRIIQQWKGIITKQATFAFWQRSFHDRIIKDRDKYQMITEYIENNPRNWKQDRFYVPDNML